MTSRDEPVNGEPGGAPRARFYLPDFCASVNVLAVVLIAELVALLLALARSGFGAGFWSDLALLSMFLLWIGLGCAAVLCAARKRLNQSGAAQGALIALALMLGVTLLVSEAAWSVAASSGRLLGINAGDLGQDHLWFLLRNLIVAAIVGGLALRYFYVSHQWQQNVRAEAAARVRALQARIRPHFLFNSMNTIASLTRSDPLCAEQAVTDLADLFRVSLREVRDRIPLPEEIEVARTYERIERLRLGDRLRVDWQLEALPGDARVPALVLQPLLENAVYHGIEPLAEGGTIVIRGRLDGRYVTLSVENPHAPDAGPRGGGSGIGLENVRQRLALMFPGEGTLTMNDADGRFTVALRFPASSGDS